MTISLRIFFAAILGFQLNIAFGQKTTEKDTGIIYHIYYHGYVPTNDDKTLFWQTQNEIPHTHFIVELYSWNKWVKKAKVSCNGSPGKHKYKLKVLPHSGENLFKVTLVNDSNAHVMSSKELNSVLNNTIVPVVNYKDKKGKDKITFSEETDYEILDLNGILVKEGRGISFSYADLEPGTYTLNYDNSSTNIVKKK